MPQNGACGGRRPCGFTPTEEAPGHSEIGRTLFLLAQLERASVDAFEILAAELLLHGAPAKLVAAANQAADDEVRHTRMMRRLAQHYDGGRPCEVACPEYRRAEARSLEEIATENAMEGCVRESFGALLALWQEQVASERRIRQAMRVIAQDETRHAELAWEVALFCDPRLTPAAKKRVRKARTEAMSALSRELATDPAPELVLKLGLPSAAQAQALLLGMQQSLPA